MVTYAAQIWRCRYFWLNLAKMDLLNRYRRSMLGVGWSLLSPIVMALVLCTVFNNLFQLDARDFWMFLLAGLSFWNFIAASATLGCGCFHQGEAYIRQHRAPLAIYPLRIVLGAAFHLLLALAVVLASGWVFSGSLRAEALWSLLPGLVLLLTFGWALALLCGVATVVFPDVRHLTEIGLSIWFYATPIIYPTTLLKQRGLGWLVDYNPLAAFADLIRQPLLEGTLPEGAAFATAALTTLAVVVLGALLLARFERRLVFYL